MVMSFPFRVFGINFRRNVTLLRLSKGQVVIHSTARFTRQDLAGIREFGEPAWLLDATLMHDTFAKEGRAALPGLSYLAPNGFERVSGVPTLAIDPPPKEWAGEIDLLRIEGTRQQEHALFHRRSRTLVVADLIFSFPPETRGWPRFFARHVMGVPPTLVGVSRFFRFFVADKEAVRRSVRKMLEWDFERVVVGHYEPILTSPRLAVEQALRDAGLLRD